VGFRGDFSNSPLVPGLEETPLGGTGDCEGHDIRSRSREMRLDIKGVDVREGAVVSGNFWSCGGGFAPFARGGSPPVAWRI
jgi:hypothetical protein